MRVGTLSRSPPARRRGSKHSQSDLERNPLKSPPARRRGSKHVGERVWKLGKGSPPARRRGSKLERGVADRPRDRRLPRGGVDRNTVQVFNSSSAAVASRAEAWIETFHGARVSKALCGRLPRGGVDRNDH